MSQSTYVSEKEHSRFLLLSKPSEWTAWKTQRLGDAANKGLYDWIVGTKTRPTGPRERYTSPSVVPPTRESTPAATSIETPAERIRSASSLVDTASTSVESHDSDRIWSSKARSEPEEQWDLKDAQARWLLMSFMSLTYQQQFKNQHTSYEL